MRVLFALLLRVQVQGIEHVPAHGSFIAMMNHTNFLDPLLLAGLSPRFIVMMSKIENYHNPLFALILRFWGSIAVHRGELDLKAVRSALDVLEHGDGLMIAPEGTRSGTGTLAQAHGGIALIGQRANVPVLPVAVSGHEGFWHNLRRLKRTSVQVTFGRPFCFAPDATLKRRQQLDLMTQEAMYRLAALLPPRYRGQYSKLDQATSRVTRNCTP